MFWLELVLVEYSCKHAFTYSMQVILVTGLNRDLGISDEWFAIGDSLILTVLGQVISVN